MASAHTIPVIQKKDGFLEAASAVQAKLIGVHMVTAASPADGKKRKHSSRHGKRSDHKKHKSDKHGKATVSQLACCVTSDFFLAVHVFVCMRQACQLHLILRKPNHACFWHVFTAFTAYKVPAA